MALKLQACFHCGEPCTDEHLAQDGKPFCCQGCLIVRELLTENGLGQFYELNRHPGVRVRRQAPRQQWACLDEPALQQRLLDFADGKVSRVTLHIPAIHCVACVWLLENLFVLHPGIGKSQVNFPRREVAVSFAPEKIKLSEVVGLLASIGYEPALTLGELEKRAVHPARRRQWLQIGFAGFAFGNIMLFSLPAYLGLDSFNGPFLRNLFGGISLVLALPVLLYSAGDYWKSARLCLRQRTLTLDVPVAIGLAALYAQSAFLILSGRGVGYLDSLAGLVFFLLCGRAFQQKSHDRLAFDRDYKSFFPLAATRKTADQREESVALSQLRVGDRLLVRHGELIPADATLKSGDALVDYSLVTGESEPASRRAGDHLYAGGKQIGAAIEIETVKPVSQSYLTSLWSHETFHKRCDDDLNTLTNRFSRWFTAGVVTVAVLAGLFWAAGGDWARGLKAFTSVLVVACPCALALAAPFALGTAQRLLARRNVFTKNTLVLERLAQVDAIVFDKTGTLTAAGAGAPVFHGAAPSPAENAWIYSLARQSTHPHSLRIAESLGSQAMELPVTDFVEQPGHGTEGRVQRHVVRLGSAAWLAADGGSPPGGTVHVSIDGAYRGAFSLTNELRPGMEQLIRGLAGRCQLALLSGDNERERERFRGLFGDAAALHFNQSPHDKLNFIRELQASGKTVMMIGDGLNDAGALQQSDVGVAVVEKVGAFSAASDVIMAAGEVRGLPEILKLARRSMSVVRASLCLSTLYNVVGVSIAAAGALSPLICSVLMPLSSVSVVLFASGATVWFARRCGMSFGLSARGAGVPPALGAGELRLAGGTPAPLVATPALQEAAS
jgi:Cu+-exporting ATPase